ncbi:MAG: Sec-independent protein translocase protein TatB [Burkholderiales bacterium]
MFDIGFSELMVIAVVALIVIGPERLPKVARTVGHLFGRMQRYVNDVKSDISREMALDDLRKLQASMQDTARSIEESVNQEVRSAEDEMNRISNETQSVVAEAAPAEAPAAVASAPAEAAGAGSSEPAKPAKPS